MGIPKHSTEAEQRWNHTEAWRQSARRSAAYTSDDWNAIRSEAAANVAAFAAAMLAGHPPHHAEATTAAEAHRLHTSRWFYDLAHEAHRRLGDLYAADPRFAQPYERVAPGLAAYVCAAIHANAERYRFRSAVARANRPDQSRR